MLGPLGHIRNAQAEVPIDFDHFGCQGWRLLLGTRMFIHPVRHNKYHSYEAKRKNQSTQCNNTKPTHVTQTFKENEN
jgi:hypothetical protein